MEPFGIFQDLKWLRYYRGTATEADGHGRIHPCVQLGQLYAWVSVLARHHTGHFINERTNPKALGFWDRRGSVRHLPRIETLRRRLFQSNRYRWTLSHRFHSGYGRIRLCLQLAQLAHDRASNMPPVNGRLATGCRFTGVVCKTISKSAFEIPETPRNLSGLTTV
jgi:hypothetical protein